MCCKAEAILAEAILRHTQNQSQLFLVEIIKEIISFGKLFFIFTMLIISQVHYHSYKEVATLYSNYILELLVIKLNFLYLPTYPPVPILVTVTAILRWQSVIVHLIYMASVFRLKHKMKC